MASLQSSFPVSILSTTTMYINFNIVLLIVSVLRSQAMLFLYIELYMQM